jgi:DNA-binding NtrC family response regulator/nitrogen-specific signal transduction histidine kinase
MRYLYAEDNPIDADILCAHFAMFAPDVQIEIVDSGARCLHRLSEEHFDLLLLDNHLPDTDGLDLLRAIRNAGHDIPVVMITGDGNDMTIWRALHEGADNYVPKSAGHLDNLPELLAGLLRRHRSRGLLDSVDRKREHQILYIEPNAMDAELTAAHFAQSAPDLRLHAAVSADHALSLIAAGTAFDLVLTDLRLPGMSAMELIRETQHRGIDAPFVIITGRGDEATAVALLRLGAYDYIVKRDNYLVQLPHSLRHALHRFRLDVTTHALQSELMALNASLEQKVAQRTAELEAEARARLRAQEALQHSEDLLKMAGRMARLGAWMIELPLRRMVWSEELATICEVDPGHVPSVDEAIEYCANPWRAMLRQRLDSCMRDAASFDEELQMITARGRLVWVRVMGQAVRGANSAVVRVQGTIQDITERKQAEADRHELEARLRESQKLEAIGTFAGGIAHDFNNMLGAILGNVALARGEVDAHALQTSLTQIHRTAVRGRSLVQQILAFSRRQPQAFVVQLLRPLIEESVGMLRPMLPAMVRVETCLTDAPAWVEADSTQIQQVLINLCVNAWHAMQGSTGHLLIGLEVIGDTAGAPGTPSGRRAHLWVRDNGSGMDAETRARIFEPFFTTKSGHGTGLGLAVVHGIVLAHRGSITVESTPGHGSTFHLLFPLAPEPADEAPAWLPSTRGDLPRADDRHVLYVDDDEVMMLMVERLLQRAGYRISAFLDPEEALDAVKADPDSFDVAVCDFNMPALSGLDFARALALIRPQLPVIISSGYLPEEAQAEALQLGVRGLLQKQNTFDELDRLIRRVLAHPAP